MYRFFFIVYSYFKIATTTVSGWSFQNAIINYIKTSTLFNELHEEHVASNQVRHMMKSTPLVNAPDTDKIQFANGPIGKLISDMMASEQALLGDWKIEKIVEAAGQDFNEQEGYEYLIQILNQAPITLFSFVDCPWCLLAKQLLEEEYQLINGDGTLQVIELEDMARDGKRIRASIALSIGRTSMPALFIGSKSVGGYTDGFVLNSDTDNKEESGFQYVPPLERDLRCLESPGLAILHERKELAALFSDATL